LNGVGGHMKQQHRCNAVLLTSLIVLLVMAVPVYYVDGDETPTGYNHLTYRSPTPASDAPQPAPVSTHAHRSPIKPRFSGDHAYAHVVNQVGLGPRPVGTEAGWNAGEQIIQELNKLGWDVDIQAFEFRGIKGRNIIARAGSGPIVMLGAHYDTRPISDREWYAEERRLPVPGANDAASGVAVLLEIARVLDVESTGHQVRLAFFDAEDRGGIDEWPYSVGADVMVKNLDAVPEAVVIVDMVGDADQQIFFEKFSDRALSAEVWKIAARLGYEKQIIPRLRHAVGDDHLPFINAGIPAISIIDFDYRYWHTLEDTPDKLSPDSLERVGRTLVTWLQELGNRQEELKLVENSRL
jgi:glutaminyl-peptide cyclotransferase